MHSQLHPLISLCCAIVYIANKIALIKLFSSASSVGSVSHNIEALNIPSFYFVQSRQDCVIARLSRKENMHHHLVLINIHKEGICG